MGHVSKKVDNRAAKQKQLNQIFHDTRRITPKSVKNSGGPYPLRCACGQHSSFRRNVAAVVSRRQLCFLFNRPEI